MRGKQKAFLGTVLALAGTTVTVPMMAGPASAQAGFRICGVEFSIPVPDDNSSLEGAEILWKFYKVGKDNGSACDSAVLNQTLTEDLVPSSLKTVRDEFVTNGTRHFSSLNSWPLIDTISSMTCENFTASLGQPSGGDKDLVGHGGDLPSTLDKQDICHNMNPSKNAQEMIPYWAYQNVFDNLELKRGEWTALHVASGPQEIRG